MISTSNDTSGTVGLNDSIPKCGCGRSPNGICVGWHNLNEEQYAFMAEQFNITKVVFPTHHPEQDWTVEERIAGLK